MHRPLCPPDPAYRCDLYGEHLVKRFLPGNEISLDQIAARLLQSAFIHAQALRDTWIGIVAEPLMIANGYQEQVKSCSSVA